MKRWGTGQLLGRIAICHFTPYLANSHTFSGSKWRQTSMSANQRRLHHPAMDRHAANLVQLTFEHLIVGYWLQALAAALADAAGQEVAARLHENVVLGHKYEKLVQAHAVLRRQPNKLKLELNQVGPKLRADMNARR